jgi:hypothetical protein
MQIYDIGQAYQMMYKQLYVIPADQDTGKPDFDSGFMITTHPNYRPNSIVLCLETQGSYIKFLFEETCLWIYDQDADACLRPIA